MHDRLSITVPFGGFYESTWSYALDRAVEQFAENYNETSDVDVSEFAWEFVDYKSAYREIARDYLDAYNHLAPLPLNLRFEDLDSPREYNFTTDRIFATIAPSTARRLFTRVRPLLQAQATQRFTSRSGFASFYDPDVTTWPKSLKDWDHNQLGTLLKCLEPAPDYEIEEMIDFDQIFERHMNWEKFEERARPDYVPPEPRCTQTLEMFL